MFSLVAQTHKCRRTSFVAAPPMSQRIAIHKSVNCKNNVEVRKLPSVRRYAFDLAMSADGFEVHSSRRRFLQWAQLALAIVPLRAEGLSEGRLHSGLSELVSKIPGAGKSDLYFPDYFLGNWTLIRVLYDVETLSGFESVKVPGHTVLSLEGVDRLRKQIGIRQQYNLRFIVYREHIIEDRLHDARAEVGLDSDRQQRLEATWDADNPNILSAAWAGESGRWVREVKVTKRAFQDDPQGKGTFATSEYARVADLVSEGALVGFGQPPSIYGRRRMARYRVRYSADSDSGSLQALGIDRIVVEYLYPPSGTAEKPAVVIKYRDFLKRKSQT